MVVPANPLDRLRTLQARRLRTFTVLHAAGVVVAVAVVGWFALETGLQSFLWAFAVLAVVMPAGVVLVWWLNRSAFRRTLSAFDAFGQRVRDAKLSLAIGYVLLLDNGLAFEVDQRNSVIRFLAFFSAGGAFVRPDMTQVERQAMRVRGLQTQGGISSKKGPPEARAELNRLRDAFGAKWYALFLRDVRPEKLTAGEPMRHEILAFFVPRWWEHARSMVQELDTVSAFLEGAPGRYFSSGSVPS